MPFTDTLEKVARVVSRETLGAVLRAKSARTDGAQRAAWLMTIAQGRDITPLEREDYLAEAAKWTAGDEAVRDLATVIHAVADVESGGVGGFDKRGRVTPLVEPHIFSKATGHAFDRSHPWISYPTWVRYQKDAAPPAQFPAHPYSFSMDDRYGLLCMMAELDLEGAFSACSAGRFQQLVYGWRDLKFASAEALFAKLANSERDQLEVMIIYMRAHGLMPALLNREKRDWRAIARGYNGPGQVEVYAARMAEAFKKRLRTYA